MKEIKLTRGLFALVDDDDFEWLNQWKWNALKHRDTFYAVRTIYPNGGKITIRMHRLVLGLTDVNVLCDHADLNGLNNQRNNLRKATVSQNNANKGSIKNSSSQYLGVSWHKHRRKWQAKLRIHGKQIYLGIHDSEQKAGLAYNEAAIIHHGEFANLNKI